ncbi:transmembrane protein 92 [Spea bombifrons]|uniref:transmembrane protein 92 n=1 Tax=Spea bombifrons TaxID=233779 RepID=UPI00234ADE9E|nr:transmembrane protein 92 [Spea bombifrons]
MVVGSVHRTVYTNLLSGCLLPLSAAVSRCSVTECLNGSSCCEPQTKIYLDYSWYGPLFICMLIIFSVLCLCGICNKGCCSRSPSRPPSPRETPLTDMGPPPPYSEVTAKPFLYPPSTSCPPPYSSVIPVSPSSSLWGDQS